MAFREKHGALHLLPHVEHAGALAAYTTACTVPRKPGSKAPKFKDFLPHRKTAADTQPIDIKTAMKNWR